MDENNKTEENLVNLVRLSLTSGTDDVRLFTAKLVRQYRKDNTNLSEQLENLLKNSNSPRSVIRKNTLNENLPESNTPSDEKSQMSLLKFIEDSNHLKQPLYTKPVEHFITSILDERKKIDLLLQNDLHPTRSAIFTGKPGLGKTLSAQWIAHKLGLPFFILDLTTVMSSFLGKTGSNLRAALDYAKSHECVLLLDEIDSIAKKRGDSGDVGELKRLVTVILQEIENWPSNSLLLAATNHPELLDPAIWRRFDLIVNFELPDEPLRRSAILQYLGPEMDTFSGWIDVLSHIYEGMSYSEIERSIKQIRRSYILSNSPIDDIIISNIHSIINNNGLDKNHLKTLFAKLVNHKKISQRKAADITGFSRDTLRKESKRISEEVVQ